MITPPPATTTPPLADEQARARFVEEIGRNFSLIAPAGVGKTRSIVDRILRLAASPRATELLPRLVVVTYTNRAAEEMKQRARLEMLRKDVSMATMKAFHRTFFGTIHSFCLRLLASHGRHLGIPSRAQLLDDKERKLIWREFLGQHRTLAEKLPEAQARDLLRHVSPITLFHLGREMTPPSHFQPIAPPIGECPPVHAAALLEFVAPKRSAGTIGRAQDSMRRFVDRIGSDTPYIPWPQSTCTAKEFVALWQETLAPRREWLRVAAHHVAADIAQDFRHFRLRRGLLSFDDQVLLAAELFRHPEAAREIRDLHLSVILDEAQDTDPAQFRVLLEATRANDDREAALTTLDEWLLAGARDDSAVADGEEEILSSPAAPRPTPPEFRAGGFAMVGDRQQMIYPARADLATYDRWHRQIVPGDADETRLIVTFRCDRAVVDFVNRVFPAILQGEKQAAFVTLQARHNAGAGQVVRCVVDLPADGQKATDAEASAPGETSAAETDPTLGQETATATESETDPGENLETEETAPPAKLSDAQAGWIEARQLARFLQKAGLEGLRARSWNQVAILCPRKRWFGPLRRALREAGLMTQTISVNEVRGESPSYAWLCALLWIMADPHCGFEIVGVLREIFGLSDHELAAFSQGRGDCFQILHAITESHPGPVDEALRLLYTIREDARTKPLRDAVRYIVDSVGLEARLQSLASDQETQHDRELDDLLTQAAIAEEEGLGLRGFAERLREGFFSAREPSAPIPGCVQLISSQKAKGLEWDAVVVPFVHRQMASAPSKYPVVRRHPGGLGSSVLLDGGDVSGEMKLAADEELGRELDRLLYVTLTRSRHTLVLVDDSALFAPGKSKPKWRNWAARLRIEGDNAAAWRELPTETEIAPVDEAPPTPAVLTAPPRRSKKRPSDDLFPITQSQPVMTRQAGTLLAAGRSRAGLFVHRETPHRYAHAPAAGDPEVNAEPEEQRDAQIEQGGGFAYGTWWHELVERLPWIEGPEVWRGHFERQRAFCPLPQRGEIEWNLLVAHPLARELMRSDIVRHSEAPFLRPLSAEVCQEGIIDLAWFDPLTNAWTVLDWKTNFIPANRQIELVENYRGQIRAYAESLAEITGCPARGTIYSTHLGAWLDV